MVMAKLKVGDQSGRKAPCTGSAWRKFTRDWCRWMLDQSEMTIATLTAKGQITIRGPPTWCGGLFFALHKTMLS